MSLAGKGIHGHPQTINIATIIDVTSTEAFLVRQEGDAGDVFIVDTTNSQVHVANGTTTLPGISGVGDPDTGFVWTSSGVITFSSNGAARLTFSSSGILMSITGGGAILNEAATVTNPTLIPYRNNVATGIGAMASGDVTLIADGVEGPTLRAVGGIAALHFPEITTPTAITNYGAIYPKSDNTLYFQDGAGTEHILGGVSAAPHAELYDQDNTDAFVVNAITELHAYHSNGLADLHSEGGWTVDVGGAGTSVAIASIADGGGGEIAVTTGAAHGLATGDIISQTNLTDAAYVGLFVVNTITSSTIYEVTAVYTATDTGTVDQAAVLIAGADNAGTYVISWHSSGTSATNNETFDFELCKNATLIIGTKSRRKFGTGGDFGTFSGGSIVEIAAGDKISFALQNNDSAGNITIRNLTMHAAPL